MFQMAYASTDYTSQNSSLVLSYFETAKECWILVLPDEAEGQMCSVTTLESIYLFWLST